MLTMNKSYMETSFKEVSCSSTAFEVSSPFQLSEEQIRKLIYETHGCSDDSFDADSLFIIVANILKRSTQIVDEVIQGDLKVPLDQIEENNPKVGFSVPMCILKKIGCELLSCKAPAAAIAHETTLTVLEKLRYYSWEAKAVLTLAAFAKEFGDLLHLVQLDQANSHDQLTKSLAILKGSCILSKTPEFRQKRKIAVVELNNLIKATLKVMETIFELEKLSIYGPKSIADLPIAVDVYWIIMTVIACANKVTILTSDEDKKQDLCPYDKKVHNILSLLTAKLAHFRLLKEEEDHYYKLLKLSRIPNEAIEFLRLLFFSQNSDHVELIDGSNNYKTVEINVLKKKRVLLIISRPDICDTDINILRRIRCEKLKKENIEERYAIVWVPTADETWPEHKKLKKEFGSWLKFKEIHWYTVNKLVSHKAGLRFLREEWQFGTSPIAVVLNVAEGKVENRNAIHTLRLWGLDAFPFDEETERRIFSEMNWLYTFFKDFPHQYGKLINWIKKEKYVLFHGGADKQWAKEIEEKVNFISKDLNIKIKRFDIEEKVDIKKRFWSGIDGLLLTKLHKEECYFAKQQVKRLSSFKNTTQGWFALNKGPTTVVVGPRATFVKAVEEFHMWKVNVRERTLEVAFKEYHEKILKSLNQAVCCSATTIQKGLSGCCVIENNLTTAGEFPEKINCPVCDQVMEITVSYKCYHKSKDDVLHC